MHGAVYNEANPEATMGVVAHSPIVPCRHIGGPVKSCTWDAENHHFVCVHADVRDHWRTPRAGGGWSRFWLQT